MCRAWVHDNLYCSHCTRHSHVFPSCAFSVVTSLVCGQVLLIQMENSHADNHHHKCIQNHNPVNALIWKNRITLPGNKRSQNASLSFLLYLHSTYKEKWQIVIVCTCMCTPTCPHIPTCGHTLTCTHTYVLSSFTQNSDMTHCWRGGILPVFWFLWF